VRERYAGELRLDPPEKWPSLGKDKVWFVGHMNDLFAEKVPQGWVQAVLKRCQAYPQNKYVFQTKNPARLKCFLQDMPARRVLGTTVETDVCDVTSPAPCSCQRLDAMRYLAMQGEQTFVTVEPVMTFRPEFAGKLLKAMPCWVNIGADSKGNDLPEPNADVVAALVTELQAAKMDVRCKPNLARVWPGAATVTGFAGARGAGERW
jgi:protein gp37